MTADECAAETAVIRAARQERIVAYRCAAISAIIGRSSHLPGHAHLPGYGVTYQELAEQAETMAQSMLAAERK